MKRIKLFNKIDTVDGFVNTAKKTLLWLQLFKITTDALIVGKIQNNT